MLTYFYIVRTSLTTATAPTTTTKGHPVTLSVAMVPSQMEEVISAQLQTLKHFPQTQQPGLLQGEKV